MTFWQRRFLTFPAKSDTILPRGFWLEFTCEDQIFVDHFARDSRLRDGRLFDCF
jgi:hypothetical protein